MHLLQVRKINIASYILAVIISGICLLIACSFIYSCKTNEVSNDIANVKNKLLRTFDENEDIADAISVKYTTQLQTKVCTIPPLFNDNNLYGFNYSPGSINNEINGTLIAVNPINYNDKCLVEAIRFIIRSLKHSDLNTRDGFRYLLKKEENKMIYSFQHLDASSFDMSQLKMFADFDTFIPMIPEYFERKLTNNIMIKGTVATPFYLDKITGGDAYSIVSFIYNLNHSGTPVAYLLYDHSLQELQKRIHGDTQNSIWLKINLQEVATGKQLCIAGCEMNNGFFTTSIVEPLSEVFDIKSEVNIIASITSSHLFKVFSLLAIMMIFLLSKVIKTQLIRINRNLFIDHLTKLYTRKIIPVIAGKFTSDCYIAIIDCDKFKYINDTYGHNAGDEVLVYISGVIRNAVRKHDVAIRHGGDEFMLIMGTENRTYAYLILERIRNYIAEKHFMFNGDKIYTSISFGLAQYNGDLQASIQEADENMYAMKKRRG